MTNTDNNNYKPSKRNKNELLNDNSESSNNNNNNNNNSNTGLHDKQCNDYYLMETLTPSSQIGSLFRRYSVDENGMRIRNKVADKVIRKLRVLEFVNEKRDDFEKKLMSQGGTSSIIRTKDKLAFVLGVVNLCLIVFLFGRFPWIIPKLFTIQFLLLFVARLYLYRQKKQHYFLFDFCYYANVFLLVYLYLIPKSESLFMICFSFANGPLIWATVAWRNSLVFHSLDKATSVLIHVFPAIVTNCIRWSNNQQQQHQIKQNNTTTTTWFNMLWIPLSFYLLWQTIYLYVTLALRKEKIKERNYITSLSFLTSRGGKSILVRILNLVPNKKMYVFVFSQFLYTVLTMIPCRFLYNNETLHLCFIFTMLVVSLWNGANYYIDYFSQTYVEQIKEKEERWKKIIISSIGSGRNASTGTSNSPMVGRNDNIMSNASTPPLLSQQQVDKSPSFVQNNTFHINHYLQRGTDDINDTIKPKLVEEVQNQDSDQENDAMPTTPTLFSKKDISFSLNSPQVGVGQK